MVNSSANYWIAANALSISLNALGDANRIQCGLATGSVIMCYIKGVDGLEYDNGHNYRRWPLTISPTYFNTYTEKYVYVAIPRNAGVGNVAQICWPSQKIDIYGFVVDENGNSTDEQIGNDNFYYIWLQGIISSSGEQGTEQRYFMQQCESGTLSTDEAVNPEGGKWYEWNNITQTVTFLKEIIMDARSRFFNLRLRNHNLTGVATDNTADENSDHDIVTPAYVKAVSNDRYLRKDQDDYTPYLLGIGEVQSNFIQSSEYTGDGMLDAGYKLWYENGRAKLVIDDLVARGKFSVNELESRIWTYAGGNMVFSGAGSTVFYVEYLNANGEALGYTYVREPWLLRGKMLLAGKIAWARRRQIQRELTAAEKAQVVKFRCYEYSDDGTMQTRNWWHTNDIAMCQTLNKVRDKVNADGSYSGYASNTVYKRRVAGIGSKKIPMLNDDRVYDYVDLWNIYDVYGQTYINSQGQTVTITDSVKGFLNMAPSGSDPSTDWPSAGDVIVQMGNPLDTDRQAAVTIEVQGDVHGFKVYDTIADYSMENKQWVEIGYDQTTGKAKANVYGDFRFGCRENEEAQGGSYVKYNRTTKVLDIKAKINAQSTMPYNGSDTTLANIFSGLNQQIDGKIETWQQDSDPASAWTTDDEKAKHVGDLWMDTRSNQGKKTYIYKDKGASANPRYVWEPQDVPQAVFDGIDGKASVYATWGAWVIDNVNKLHLRDLLIPTADITESGVTYKAGKVYRCTQVTPSIVFTEVAYTDDTNFNGYIHALLNGSGASGDAATAAAAQRAVLRAVKGDTVVDGGLLLTSLIAMRQFNGSAGQESDPTKYTTWGGISGIYDDWSGSTHAKGHGIAAWFGGAMVDKEDVQTLPASYAKSLFRMDGSGYVADGGLSWDYNGQGKTVVTLNGDVVKAANYYLDGNDITPQLDALFRMFELVNVNASDPTAEPYWMIHAKLGIYADGDVQALGYDPQQGGGGGGASVLYELNDVSPNAAHNAVLGIVIDDQNPQGDGYVLTYDYNSKHWIAAPAAETYHLPQATSQALGGIKIGYTPGAGDTRNYAVVLDNDGKAYVNVPWSGGTQSDWNETDSASLAYIKNKPSIPSVSASVSGSTLTVTINGTSYSLTDTNTWRPLGTGATDAAAGNHNHDGRYLYWGGSAADATAMTWGTLTAANGYSILSHFASSDGGDGGFVYKGGQIFMQIDGYFYQNEGAYRVYDVSGGDMNSGARISFSGGNGYLGNANNAGWLMVQDICSQDEQGDGKWSLRTNGNAHVVYLYASSDVQVTSDERRKDVIGNVQLSVEQIAQMPSVLFRWKKGFGDELVHVGTLAQSWEKVLPAAVGIGTDKEQTRSFSYSSAAYAIGVADAREIVALKKRVSELEAELKRYKSA